jgi:thiamine biosynthesis lipoprotein
LLPLITRADQLARASGELFNPAIGKLIGTWGFHSDEPLLPPPTADTVAALVAQHPGMDDLRITGDTLQSSNPAVQLDFGAIAQGYAVDLAIAQLRALGIHNAIVNASGDIRVIGKRGTRAWRIGIRNPRGPGIIASIEMEGDESIVTSGTYERYFEYQGTRYHHIIDPRSGYPASGLVSVTVLHSDTTTADAASTALLVAGPEDWGKTARALGIKDVMLIDQTGKVILTPTLAARIRFEIAPAPQIEIRAIP